jgi:hypothetical protein
MKGLIMLFLKTLILSFAIEGGIIPGHDMEMYPMDYMFPIEASYGTREIVNIDRSFYTEMSCDMEIWKHFYINGGMTAYEWSTKIGFESYPFRMDYLFGAGFKYKSIQIGYAHECMHPIAPNEIIFPYGKIDAAYDRVFIKAEIKKNLF